MATTSTSAFVCLLAGVIANVCSAAASAQDQPEFVVTTTSVVLDVVVRGRGHQPVTDLSADDFEVFEDGRRQMVTGFQYVASAAASSPDTLFRGEPGTARDAASMSPAHVVDPPTVVALVFEQLSPEGRRMAQQAATRLVDADWTPRDRVGVFVVRGLLEEILPFSRDQSAVRHAAEAAATRPGCAVFDTAPASPGASALMNRCAADDDHRMRGVATLDGLHALVERLGAFPGRKTVALFSEGLDITSGCRGQFCDDRKSRFDAVIRAAALRNVAFYTFDAAGLRLMRMATGQLMEEPRAALSVLARETGGAFAEDTNDLRPAVDRMRADTRGYYMIGFTTATPESDRPRRLRVRVRRPGTTVLVRQTYASAPPRQAR